MAPSFKNRTWSCAPVDPQHVRALQGAADLGRLDATILAGRGITPDALDQFLHPRLTTSLPNPSMFLGMDRAAERLTRAILAEEHVAVWSDYDVDGACSAAILLRFLRAHGAPTPTLHIPNRITEGYGPNAQGIQALVDKGATLLCVLDSGTTAFAPLEAAAAMGIDVLVIDHHMASDTLPPALAVVNPNRRDQAPGYGHLCAAAMTFLLANATNTRMRMLGQPGADLMPLTGLVALATVCDVVPLRTVNRAFVATGLQRLSQRTYPGVAALCAAANIDGPISATHCGFDLGPRINAPGRIGDPMLSARLLATDDQEEAHSLALQLDSLNRERRSMERALTTKALEQIPEGFVPGTTRALVVCVVEGHEGVVGISAARVKEECDAPTFVLSPTEEGVLKGSGRSVAGFDLGSAVMAAVEAGLLIKGGGHAMAAGITIAPDKVEAFTDFVNAAIARSTYFRDGLPLFSDSTARINEITPAFVEGLDRLGPFGTDNPRPRFLLTNVQVSYKQIMKDKATGKDRHIKLSLRDAATPGATIKSPLWNACGTLLDEAFTLAGNAPLDLVCTLEINEWNGRKTVELRIEDARLHVPIQTPQEALQDVALPF